MAKQVFNDLKPNNNEIQFPYIRKENQINNLSFSRSFEKIFSNRKIREVILKKNNFNSIDNYLKKPKSNNVTIDYFDISHLKDTRNRNKGIRFKSSSQISNIIKSNKIFEIKFPNFHKINKEKYNLKRINLSKNKNSIKKKIPDRIRNKPFLQLYLNNLIQKRNKKNFFFFKSNSSNNTPISKFNYSQIFMNNFSNYVFYDENNKNLSNNNNKKKNNDNSKIYYKAIKLKQNKSVFKIKTPPDYSNLEKEIFKSQIIKSKNFSQKNKINIKFKNSFN